MRHFKTRLLPSLALSLGWVFGAASLLLPLAGQAQLLSFPGVEGAGRFTKGGRGTATQRTTVYEVTSLADANTPGTLRYACSASTSTAPYRTVVFRVCGTIHLISRLNIPRNTTLAGQTAPGDGICIADRPVVINGDNVIVRFMRFRLGDRYQNGGMVNGSGNDDALDGSDRKNVVVDHCTMSWSNDEAFTFYGATCDSMTLQWNLISEPLNYSYHFETGDVDFERHGYGGIWGGKRASFHHNMFAHCANRCPRWNGTRYGATIGSENCDYSNNVIYNWGSNNVYGGEGGNYNMVNNYYKYGPNTGSHNRILNPYKQTGTTALPYPRVYLNGNYVDGNTTVTDHNWRGVVMNGGSPVDTVQAKAAVPFAIAPIALQSAPDAFTSVLAGAGCVLPARDGLDQRIMNDARNRTGAIIDVQGGYPAHVTPYSVSQAAWPNLICGPAPADSDHDGMTDAFETANGLSSTDPTDRYAIAANGYTNLENYLNGLVNPALAFPTATTKSVGLAAALQVYPNPANSQLALAHPVAVRGASIALYNAMGQKISTTVPTVGSHETTLAVDHLAPGTYLLVFSDGEKHGSCRFVRE